MLAEQLIFTVISLAIFVYTFFKMIRKNDTSYVIILILEAIGIALNFIEFAFTIKLNIVLDIAKYVLSILVPIIAIILETRGITLLEIINITKAKFYLAIGNDKKAKEALIKLITKMPNSYKGHKLLAELYEKEGGMRKAIDEYVQAIDINKKDYNSYYKVAELLDNLGKKDEAAEMLFNLLNIKPDMYKATVLLGDILIEKERYKDAANIYQEALRFNPMSYDLNYNLGIVYTMLNDFQNAKICYEKAAQINSLAYNCKYALAEIALIYKDLEEAERRFLEAIEEEELSADGYFELAKIYLIKGDKDTAIKYTNTAIDINSKKIVEKVKKDTIFIPIMARISIPFNLENNLNEDEKVAKLQEKDVKAKEHLEEMVDITRHLSYNDIKLLKKNEAEGKTKKEQQVEKGEKER
ncbi:MAG: tetratricopeptide repeat protein [Clostridia bacterium]